MKRFLSICAAALLVTATLGGYSLNAQAQASAGWTALFDGTHANDWTPIGNANWRMDNGILTADVGTGFLVSKKSYTDFEIRAEFWADSDANSGIFIRCTDATKVTADNSYEVNIYDKRPDTSYGTGAIVNVAKIPNNPNKAGGKWNTYEIVAKGPVLTVTLNGVRTVDGVRDSKHAGGPIALQYAGGTVKFRKVEIKAL
jgi:hypothetical protein